MKPLQKLHLLLVITIFLTSCAETFKPDKIRSRGKGKHVEFELESKSVPQTLTALTNFEETSSKSYERESDADARAEVGHSLSKAIDRFVQTGNIAGLEVILNSDAMNLLSEESRNILGKLFRGIKVWHSGLANRGPYVRRQKLLGDIEAKIEQLQREGGSPETIRMLRSLM